MTKANPKPGRHHSRVLVVVQSGARQPREDRHVRREPARAPRDTSNDGAGSRDLSYAWSGRIEIDQYAFINKNLKGRTAIVSKV